MTKKEESSDKEDVRDRRRRKKWKGLVEKC